MGAAGFLVTVRGSPRVGAEVQKRAVLEARGRLDELLAAAGCPGPALELRGVAHRGVFLLLLADGVGGGGAAISAAYAALAAAANAGTAALAGFQFCDKVFPWAPRRFLSCLQRLTHGVVGLQGANAATCQCAERGGRGSLPPLSRGYLGCSEFPAGWPQRGRQQHRCAHPHARRRCARRL